jgi:hypothetical protein
MFITKSGEFILSQALGDPPYKVPWKSGNWFLNGMSTYIHKTHTHTKPQ